MAYLITVRRREKQGVLTFQSGAIRVKTGFWWLLSNRIPTQTYMGCVATEMAQRRTRQASE
jgi:hypothetical protein